MLNGGNLGPFPLLEELNSGGVVQCCGWMSPEECREALAVGQRRRAGAIGQLRQEQKHVKAHHKTEIQEQWT